MQLSVIIPVHAKAERLRLTLASLQRQQARCEFETVIVADGAQPAVLALVESLPDVRLLSSPGLGRAAARNLGASVARGEILLFLDDDILVQDGFFEAHLQAQQTHGGLVHGRLRELIALGPVSDPALGTVGCPPILVEDLLAGRWTPQSARTLANPLEQAAEHPRASQWPWLASAGANISLSRSAWRQVGGFDASYGRRWGMEDLDLGYRLWRAGVRLSLEPRACGYHMSHHNPQRWEDHRHNLQLFQAQAPIAEALALDELLSPTGSVQRYIARVDQIRQNAVSPCTRQ
ncbi:MULTISPECIES: glycosyltransferase family 2 protein [Pseudomonas]|nr:MULTISPECIES: glycosyltransferase [Pseudomonas]MBS7561981.1 glycosyltransferase [Pseudomonas sp. RC4D1]MCO7578613.1 glycosyltransferase [Pseudomonas protegens]MCO7585397.1 glycosyltransferase [Pseudomonas chlororaphis]MCO7601819.1 glycosyltransferase [Pseudomonas chlororaphis]MCY7262297.1 glycosyltransferase [Pseudomonas protegens]